jgi:hypothetical protein
MSFDDLPDRGQQLIDVLAHLVKATRRAAPRGRGLANLCQQRWSATERTAVICFLAIVTGSLFVTSYSLALCDPVPPHRRCARR